MFDDVANDQRKVVYQQRTGILGATDLSEAVAGMREDAVNALIDQFVPHQTAPADWDLDSLTTALQRDFITNIDARAWLAENQELEDSVFRARTIAAVHEQYDQKVARIGAPLMRQIEREVLLRNLDSHWREHLAAMDYLRQGIHLRGYAQKDYRYEFKREAFELFSAMLDRVKHEVASVLSRIEVRDEAQVEREEAEQRERMMQALQAQHAEAQSVFQAADEPVADLAEVLPPEDTQAPFVRGERKVGRNEPCPCGSGRKYKQCHGLLSA
jgi:preprotein translocase subunit SecA